MRCAEPRRSVVVAALAAVLAQGCTGTMSWQTITKGATIPAALLWRSSTEVWAHGGASVMRRVNGSWEAVELCAPYDKSNKYSGGKQAVTIAFEDQAVWSLCGLNLDDGQTLLRHDGQGSAQVLELPPDGQVSLVPTLSGPPVLLGSTSLWTWTGTGWKAAGKNPYGSLPPSAAAVSADEVYVATEGTAGAAPLVWWNGQKWQNILAGTNSHRLELRFGKVWMGLSSLSGGEVTQVEFKAAKVLADQHLVLSALVSEKRALACGDGLTAYYFIGVDDDAPVRVGTSPKENGSSTSDVTVVDIYGNEGTVYGRLSPGKGVGRVWGVDEHSMLIDYFIEGGAFGGSGSDELIEGRL